MCNCLKSGESIVKYGCGPQKLKTKIPASVQIITDHTFFFADLLWCYLYHSTCLLDPLDTVPAFDELISLAHADKLQTSKTSTSNTDHRRHTNGHNTYTFAIANNKPRFWPFSHYSGHGLRKTSSICFGVDHVSAIQTLSTAQYVIWSRAGRNTPSVPLKL